MDTPTNDFPGPNQARLDPTRRDDLLTALPDAVIHRVLDFLVNVYGLSRKNVPGASNELRTAFSRTCRRMNEYYRNQYVTSYSSLIDFQTAGNLLKCFPRLNALQRCTLDEVPIEASRHLYHQLTHIFIFVKAPATNLCLISRACPSLKSLMMERAVRTGMTQIKLCVENDFSLPSLEILYLRGFSTTVEALVKLLSSPISLRDLTVINVREFTDVAVMRALPQTLERLELKLGGFRSDDQLEIVGNLPLVKNLHITFDGSARWLNLMPAAARLKKLFMWIGHGADEDFCRLLARMKSLKSLNISISNGGSWDGVLRAISNLDLLEDLKLKWFNLTTEPSTRGLRHLANGTVRRTLVECNIDIPVKALNVLLWESLNSCFKNEIVPLFEKRRSGFFRLH